VSLDREILREIDTVVESSKRMNISLSQVVEAILAAFLKPPFDYVEKVRDLVVRRRVELLYRGVKVHPVHHKGDVT